MKVGTPTSKRAKRAGLAGLIASVLIFGILFTAVITYFYFQSSSNLSLAQANASANLARQQASHENLQLGIFNVTNQLSPAYGNLWLNITNVGGSPSTVVAVFVTNSAGQLVSTGPTSPYLTGPYGGLNYLNVTLPLAVPVGVSTTSMGKDIGISSGIKQSPKAFDYIDDFRHQTVYVNVLTAAGNTFSIQFPHPLTTTTTTNLPGGTTTTTSWSTSSSSTSQTISSVSTSTSVGCNGQTDTTCNTASGFLVGTNSMVVQMCAWYSGTTCQSSPTGGFDGGTVTLSVTVTAGIAVTPTVVIMPIPTGTVPQPTGSCPSSPSSSTTTGSTYEYTFTCTYNVLQGNIGGTITFIGYSVATVGGSQVTSAESTSNTITVGNLATELTGPLSLDYTSFRFYSTSNQGGNPTPVITASQNKFAAFSVKVTNTGNASITILQYSYLQFARVSQEMDFYIIGGAPSYSGNTFPSFSGCSGLPPSGCGITVAVGATVTLYFAACQPMNQGSSSGSGWLWGSNYGNSNNPNCGTFNALGAEGVNALIVANFAEQPGPTKSWVSFSQTLPGFGIYFT